MTYETCDKCGEAHRIKDSEFRVPTTTRVVIQNKPIELCSRCFGEYEEIKKFHRNQEDAELMNWLGRR